MTTCTNFSLLCGIQLGEFKFFWFGFCCVLVVPPHPNSKGTAIFCGGMLKLWRVFLLGFFFSLADFGLVFLPCTDKLVELR